ncbi:uncharacterized protein LOC143180714 isoform X2 [Calliopsis andreniformis]|uniref:uncharacterized protein LOC143180714 isoform X2 n=1 Tax=Calliopsis andreniformis TaxID=337506 RepID=UPI003FCECA64
MARRFSWCTVVALVVLLFVTTEGLRERGTQVDDHKAHSTKDRGTLRYNFKSPEETSTSASSLSRARSRNRTSHLERHNGSISKPSINSEAKVESNRRSNFRTARTTERNVVSAATETTNTPQKTLERDSENIKKIEPAIHRKNDHRHPSEHNKPPKPKVDEQSSTLVTPTEASRRSSNRKSDNPGVTKRLDDIGPSFFTATTEFSRSRTGRKVQTSYTTSELKTQLPTSRKFNNKKFEGIETTTAAFKRTESRGRSTTERSDRGRSGRSKVTNRENNTISRRIDGPDPLLSESESIRVDVPLTVEATESLIVNTTTESIVRSQRQSIDTNRRSDTKDSSKANTRPGSERFKIRGRANDTESASPAFRNSSRRGSSKFNDYATTEASEANSRRNTVSRDRSRISESNKSSTNEVRPRSRGRNLENSGKSSSIVASERDVKRKLPGDRNTSERRSRVLDLGARPAENRGQDQDTRGRSRSRSRLDATTAAVSVDTITTAAPDTTVSNEITTSSTEASTEVTSTTIRPTSPATTTTSSRTLTTTARPTINTAASEGSGRNRGRGRGGGNQGRKQAKEDFFNHGLGFRGRRPSPEGSPNVEDSKKPTASKNDSQNQGNPGWTLRRRPSHLNHSETLAKIVPSPKDQTNEVIPPNEQLTSTEIISTIESSTTTTRRGFKKQQSSTEESTIVNGTTKSFRRGNKTFEKNRTFGIGKGSTEPDESDNYPPDFKARLTQLVKKSSAALFAERSRMKLELARRLVKPELNIEENDLDATTASSFSKSKSTGASAVDETSKVAKFENPGAAERRSSTEASQDDDKASKLSKLEKSLEDSSKLRPSVLRKGRIVSERMVTSISVEERPEETTKSYASTNPSVSTVFAEEGSATTVDSTKVRLAALRGGKKSKEDDKASVRENDSVTTFKPKKPYVHRSRNSKSQDQSSTAEQTSVSTLKKSYSSSNKQNIGQRKSLSSQEEDVTKKPRFTESDTKSTFRPRYSKRTKVKSVDGTEEQTLTTKVPLATSRYSRKKSIIKSTEGKVKITTTEGPATPTRKQEFRPRTATYRRHSEVPTTLVESTTKTESTGVAITPRVPRYHATLKSSTQSSRSVPQEPQVNLNIVNDTAQQAPGITGGSNGDIGNSNIFNPTRSAFLSGNDTLLEQLRSTVAPLLSSLGNKTPVFSGSYSNVNNANSAPRITPSGSPPRFSARYKGAELFVRKQNNIYQPTVPSITSSSTTPVTPVEDTTSSTAQGTAGSGIGQTTESISTTPSSDSSTPLPSQSPATTTTSPSVATTTGTTPTTTGTATTTSTQVTTEPARMNVVTITSMSETTVLTPVTTVDINENLVSTEASETTTVPSVMNVMNDTSTGSVTEASMAGETTPRMMTTTIPPGSPSRQTLTTPYVGRFGGNRMTPAPRFSLSSTTKAPLRDYLIYGIYPNKTIVRKRPEDNLIDARNVNSPYVIFGIFPDGKLVRKFPNGTIIPDPPRSPVEVVFSLSTTTTTNRPPPRPFYNQANQGTYNQYQGPVYDNNRRPVAEPMRNVQRPGTVDLGLTGNAIVGPNGGGPDFTGPLGTPAIAPSTNEMSNTPMNAQTGTTSNVMSAIAGRPPTDSQGSRIVQDRERDEATRTKEAGGQRSSVYIGQDKFVNYWTNGDPATNQRVVSVNISSVASAANEGPSPSVPSFENLLNSQPGGRVTAPPGFPWRDPLDQIFGITTSSPVITASVASNTLDDSGDTNSPVFARPVNPFVEVFTPFSSAIGNIKNGAVPSTQSTSTTAATTVTPATTTTTTTAQTTTTTMAPTTTTTTTTTVAPTTTTVASTTTSAPATTTAGTTVNTPPPVTSLNLPANLLTNMQQQNAFGTTFDDLAFLNSLTNSRQATPKTLTEVEQLLANKILSLALNNPGPTRSPKAINIENASPNSIYYSSPKSVDPVVIDLSPSSTAATPTWKPVPTEQTTEKPISTTTTKPIVSSPPTTTTTKTSLISTTKAPVAITVKTTPRPRTTTPPSLGFGASLWQALFGNGLFAPPTTQRPLKPKQVKTTPKSVNITPKPVPITQKPETTTLRTVDVSKIQVSTPNSIVKDAKPASTSNSISTTKQPLLNNPNPRLSNAATSTFSPEEDAKFLLALLQAADEENKTSGSKKSSGLTQDDESFLRAILSGRALTTTTTPAPSNDISNAALLAALLKAQGIEPPTPATNIREQLLLASLGQSVSSAPTASPATESTTITTRPPSTATRPTVTTKKPVTPRPTSGPRIRTTTWSPSSTYPPPLFSSFSNYGTPVQSSSGDNSGGGALLGATRAFSQFLGAAISGAAKQLQSLVRNSTRIMSGVVGQN